jgi:transcriptional repressor NrdR
MKCPYCDNPDTKVVDSRPTDEGQAIRRRRECEKCGRRFTTYEKIEEIPLIVVKKDGRRQVFDRNKVRNGIIRACEKRPVPIDEIEKIVAEIEKGLSNLMLKEMDSSIIGEYVMEQLKDLDDVAYVRFASVYRQFTDAESFKQEIEKLLETPAKKRGRGGGKGSRSSNSRRGGPAGGQGDGGAGGSGDDDGDPGSGRGDAGGAGDAAGE